MSWRVVHPGFSSWLVDLGRSSSRHLGVPLGGAADRWSFVLGNALVGNPPNTVALEITLSGPVLQAESDVAGVVFGAPFELQGDPPRLAIGKTFNLRAGERLHIRGTRRGVRAYLCVPGGFESPMTLGSRSAWKPIQAGQILTCRPSRLPIRQIAEPIEDSLPHEPPQALRFLPGGQADWFDLRRFQSQQFLVTADSNRMGLRLRSEPLTRPQREMISEPVCPGTVQVTNDGQCVILGVDGQTIGGYPKIAHVIRADWDWLGQLRPNDMVRFVEVSWEEAELARRILRDRWQTWLTRLAVASDCPGIFPLPRI
jgi:antagonist of KipI